MYTRGVPPPAPNKYIFLAAFISLVFVLLPFIIFDIQYAPHNQYAGILEFFRENTRGSIPLNEGKSIEYDPINSIRGIPIGEDSLKDIKESVPDFEKINKDIDEKSGINFFKFFKWIWRGIKAIFGFIGNLIV